MKRCTNFLAMGMATLALSSCAAHRRGIDLVIDCTLPPGAVRLRNCSGDSPPHCEKVTVTYKPGCERMVISQ